ncbi:major capsid protein [Pseudomonas sp. 2FE]|uniref:major capsid protein n=1 Tax=Pseudomonas sp. 2FE TaxID=2502190 RepID=UPI0010F62AF2|nr:major capsid protein [Pseudomonas sp. 2FE]
MKKLQIVRRVLVGSAVSAGLLANQAFAAVPAEATTALTDAKADALNVAGVVLVIIIAIAAFKFIKKAI